MRVLGRWIALAAMMAAAGCLPGPVHVADGGEDPDAQSADAGGTDSDSAVCQDPSCGACGVKGSACCANGACLTGMACLEEICIPCGGTGDVCCVGPVDPCRAGNNCVAGVCAACGAPGQACCDPGASCQAGSVCDDGSCVACGARDQECCANDACALGLHCSNDHLCQ